MNWLFCKITDISDEQYQIVYNSLTASRKAHIDRMKLKKDRQRSLAANYLLKRLLAEFGQENATLEATESGKPYLSKSDMFISISHSEDGVVCAMSDLPIGIDIEKIRPVSMSLIDYICTPQERAFILSEKALETNESCAQNSVWINFFSVWTAKEAYFKKFAGEVKNIRSVDTLQIVKEIHFIDDFIITII